jgi:choline kinase
MKAVILSAGQGKRLLLLTANTPKCLVNIIGKKLPPDRIDAESIGMILFREKGPLMLRSALDNAMRDHSAYKKWYLSVIAQMAQSMPVWTFAANGLQWCEVDFPADLKQAQKVVRTFYEGDQLSGYRQKNHALGKFQFGNWDCRFRIDERNVIDFIC